MNSLYETLVDRSIDNMSRCQGICIIFICVTIIISFRKLDLNSQTSNICNFLSPLYHAYFQQIALAVFKIVKQCLTWDFFCGFSCWTPRHGQKGPMKKGLKKMMSKMVKKGQKTRSFGLFKKIKSLVLSRIIVKREFLWSFSILEKLHSWEKSRSEVIMAKNVSRSMRFQYSLIVNI